jgi:hypothetical protein
MAEQENPLHNFGMVGRRYLQLQSRGHDALADYNWTLSQVWELLKRTHSIVVAGLKRVESAEDLDLARAEVNRLRRKPLSDAFRAQGLCDVLEGFGHSIHRLARPGFLDEESMDRTSRSAWEKFCHTLESKEDEVAGLYAEHIRELRDLIDKASSGDLGEIKQRAGEARRLLTEQISEFDALAQQFRDADRVV